MIPRGPLWTSPELDAVVASRGGLFRLEGQHAESTANTFGTLVARFDRYVEYAESSLFDVRPRKLSFGFLCSSEFNAFAYAAQPGMAPSLDFVGINVGVVFTLSDTFSRILADPACFPEVGDSSVEAPQGLAPRPLSTDVMSRSPIGGGPRCPVRASFAGVLAQTALDYLFFHEITHLRNGHCEYGRDHLAMSCLAEIAGDTKASQALVRHALEMDADCGAILLTLNEAFRLKDMLASTTREVDPIVLHAVQAAYGDAERATRTVAYSAYVLFRLFDDSRWDHEGLASRSHPQSAVRMSWIGPTLYEIFLQRPAYGYEPEAFVADMGRIVLAAETDCGRIQGVPPDPRGIMSVYSTTQSADYLNQLKVTWSSIRPLLEAHKRGGRLPD